MKKKLLKVLMTNDKHDIVIRISSSDKKALRQNFS